MLKDYISKGTGKVQNEIWPDGAIGLFQGIAYRLFKEYPQYCTIPHIVLLKKSIVISKDSIISGKNRPFSK